VAAANRREITVTSFDFTHGAFRLAVRARRVGTGLVGTLTAGLVLAAALAFNASSAATGVESERDALLQREAAVIASIGDTSGAGVDARTLMERETALSQSLSAIVAPQVEYSLVIAELERLQVPGVVISSVALGPGAVSLRSSSPAPFDPTKGTPVIVTATSPDILSTVTWADLMRQSPVFTDLVPSGDGSGSVLQGYVRPGAPAAVSVKRLALTGFEYVAVAPTAPAPVTLDPATGLPVTETVPAVTP
jgi:hypothetical protein